MRQETGSLEVGESGWASAPFRVAVAYFVACQALAGVRSDNDCQKQWSHMSKTEFRTVTASRKLCKATAVSPCAQLAQGHSWLLMAMAVRVLGQDVACVYPQAVLWPHFSAGNPSRQVGREGNPGCLASGPVLADAILLPRSC